MTSIASSSESIGICYRGSVYSAPKQYWRGTQRTVAPQETLERIRPCFKTAGLTRLANITGLDRIGIPTVLAIRPNSPTITTSAGKGFTLAAAMVSAAMEAIEIFHAETIQLPSFQLAYSELGGAYGIIPVENLPLTKHSLFQITWPYYWVLGWDIVHQEDVAVPIVISDLVLRGSKERIWELASFQVNTNGLASGNHFLEAVAAGLYEVIERDAVTCYSLAERTARRAPPLVRPETIADPLVIELLDRMEAARVAALLFDCTIDTDVPVYQAYIYEQDQRHYLGIFKGAGAHLDPGIAMIRALTEAIQSRLVYIAGSRDDVFQHTASRMKSGDSAEAIRSLKSRSTSVNARLTSEATPTFEGDLQVVLSKLQHSGLNQVIVFDLTQPGFPISAVKVVVPGLEGYKSAAYTPGHRAKAFSRRA